jgi:hypothetical protein
MTASTIAGKWNRTGHLQEVGHQRRAGRAMIMAGKTSPGDGDVKPAVRCARADPD